MISKNNIKLIKSLTDIKNRKKTGLFLAEGDKIVKELISSDYSVKQLFATKEWIDLNKGLEKHCTMVSLADLAKISQQKTPNHVLVIAELPEQNLEFNSLNQQLCLVLDNIQDPGNLGTLIRICNWYGILNIICSSNSVDAFNPKVVQASMGAIFRTKIYYVELDSFLKEYKKIYSYPATGAFLDGESIYDMNLEPYGLLILGNESNGISENISKLVDQRITIPAYPQDKKSMESLNVSMAGAIFCSEYRRRLIQKNC